MSIKLDLIGSDGSQATKQDMEKNLKVFNKLLTLVGTHQFTKEEIKYINDTHDILLAIWKRLPSSELPKVKFMPPERLRSLEEK